MDQLQEKIKTLKEVAINLTDVTNNCSKLAYIIKEIQKNQKKVLDEIEATENINLANEYQKWVNENEAYLMWLIKLCIDIDNLKNKNITLIPSKDKNLENLIQFLTKYQTVYNKISNEETSEKIKNQINALYQDIFETHNNLITAIDEANFSNNEQSIEVPIINPAITTPETEEIFMPNNSKSIIKMDSLPKENITYTMIEPYFKPAPSPIKTPKIIEEPITEEKIIPEPLKTDPLKEEPFKENVFKDQTLKGEPLFKEEPFKTQPFKEDIFKDQAFKREPLKKDTFKENIFKEEPSKFNEKPLKEDIFQEKPFKEHVFKEEPVKKDFFKTSNLPQRETKKIKSELSTQNVNWHLKDEFNVSLSSRLYQSEYIYEEENAISATCLYIPNLPRQIKALGIKVKDKVYIASLRSEVEKLLNNNGEIISVLSSCDKLIEGWYPIEDIKKIIPLK